MKRFGGGFFFAFVSTTSATKRGLAYSVGGRHPAQNFGQSPAFFCNLCWAPRARAQLKSIQSGWTRRHRETPVERNPINR